MYEVSAEWMKACGKGDQAKVFRVIRSYELGGWVFADLDDDGRVWTVMTAWRGRYV